MWSEKPVVEDQKALLLHLESLGPIYVLHRKENLHPECIATMKMVVTTRFYSV